MNSTNLEIELSKADCANWTDKIDFSEHHYNGFQASDGVGRLYYRYYRVLFNDYFTDFSKRTLNLTAKDRKILVKDRKLRFIKLKRSFNNRKLNNYTSILKKKRYIIKNVKGGNTVQIQNEIKVLEFYIKMMKIQLRFIDKSIVKLSEYNSLYIKPTTHKPIPASTNTALPKKTTDKKSPQQIVIKSPTPNPPKTNTAYFEFNRTTQEEWDNTLKDYGDILDTFDLVKIFRKNKQTVNRWKREGKITPIYAGKPYQYKKDDIKTYLLNLKKKK